MNNKKIIKEFKLDELTNELIDFIGFASIALNHSIDAKRMRLLAQLLAEELINKKRFNKLYLYQIGVAIKEGVIYCDFEPFLNLRTFIRLIIEHKKKINEAYYQVHTLNKKPEEVPYYQEPKKLLK